MKTSKKILIAISAILLSSCMTETSFCQGKGDDDIVEHRFVVYYPAETDTASIFSCPGTFLNCSKNGNQYRVGLFEGGKLIQMVYRGEHKAEVVSSK